MYSKNTKKGWRKLNVILKERNLHRALKLISTISKKIFLRSSEYNKQSKLDDGTYYKEHYLLATDATCFQHFIKLPQKKSCYWEYDKMSSLEYRFQTEHIIYVSPQFVSLSLKWNLFINMMVFNIAVI